MESTAMCFNKAGRLGFGGMIGSSQELRNVWHSVQTGGSDGLRRPHPRARQGRGRNSWLRRFTRRALAATDHS